MLHNDRGGLLLRGLEWYGTHRRARRRFADRLGVVAVVLVPLDEGFHVLRWDQLYPVAKAAQ